MKAIVTVKLPRNPVHNPKRKREGICPIIRKKKRVCTDITGSHHSFIEHGKDLEDIRRKVLAACHHITRIEVIEK